MVDTHGDDRQPWIGVDLDGTLAEYHGWKGIDHIGPPIRKMAERVHRWVMSGKCVKIMTARVAPGLNDRAEAVRHIRAWLKKHFNPAVAEIDITHEKDCLMTELWDDRCVQVIPNTGERADGLPG